MECDPKAAPTARRSSCFPICRSPRPAEPRSGPTNCFFTAGIFSGTRCRGTIGCSTSARSGTPGGVLCNAGAGWTIFAASAAAADARQGRHRVHGMFRNTGPLLGMARFLRRTGEYTVFTPTYPSNWSSIRQSAATSRGCWRIWKGSKRSTSSAIAWAISWCGTIWPTVPPASMAAHPIRGSGGW